jgi:hypothetical protein
VTATNQPLSALGKIENSSTAHKDGVRTLYKFMSYPRDGTAPIENAERRKRVEALLCDGELYFATARELNDPFEAAPHFRIPEISPNETLEAFMRPLRNVYAREWGWNEKQILAYEKNLSEEIQSGAFQVRITSLMHKLRESLKSEYPMCCLASTQDSTLMWSYYSGGHTGICIHFEATSNSPFSGAKRVIYSQQFPEVPLPFAELDPNELINLALFTKSDVWDHEREYRLINMLITFPPAKPTRLLDGLFSWKTDQIAVVPPQLIIGVTIGASMQETEIDNVLRICHDRSIKIPVFQAKCRQDRFDLDFSQIA